MDSFWILQFRRQRRCGGNRRSRNLISPVSCRLCEKLLSGPSGQHGRDKPRPLADVSDLPSSRPSAWRHEPLRPQHQLFSNPAAVGAVQLCPTRLPGTSTTVDRPLAPSWNTPFPWLLGSHSSDLASVFITNFLSIIWQPFLLHLSSSHCPPQES